MSHVLNAHDFPLWGSRLIEASAGTGKTWTIAALYLRLVLGHGGANAHPRALLPSEILVMTFTRAATRELSDRIRARLTEAVQCFRGEAQPAAHDTLLQGLLADYPEGQERTAAAWRLAMAAEAMDDAAVFTIDAWCQRMLREHAFDSGNLFDEELAADEEQLRREAVQDYWRQQCYPLGGELLETVLGVWSGLDALAQDMRGLLDQAVDPAAGQGSLADAVQAAQAERATALTDLAQGWGAQAQALRDWLDAQVAAPGAHWDGRKLAPRHYTGWLQSVIDWAAAPQEVELTLTESARHRLSPEGLLEARKKGAPALAVPPGFEALQQLLADMARLPQLGSRLRLHAAARVLQRLAQLKRQQGTFGFADLLQRLDRALAGDNGAALRARIQAQYPAALIDEFQDTSPLQYRLFERIYRTQENDAQTALLLIGDPKQSIYGFRGADIYSYLQARDATAGRHYVLDRNYRSTQALVDAVNHWFGQAEQRGGAGAFMFRSEAGNPLPFVAVQAQGRKEVFQAAGGAVPALQLQVELDPLQTAKRAQRGFAARCAAQIVQWLNDPEAGFAAPGEALARLRPADIAVLVRTGNEARAVRRELGARGVASVYLSDNESVFAGSEAQDLVVWLHAVAAPRDARAVRAGLATRLLDLSLDELGWLAADDEAFDARCEQLRALQGVWQGQGVLAMLRQTLHQFDLPARWLAETGGERRLTNYLHLAELLQSASAQLEGEHALIRWLTTQCAGEGSHSDEQIVRLESDADLVKVVTVHKSKGLEYPVVFLPFACSFREINRRMDRFVSLPKPEGGRALRLDYDDAELAQADDERLREDLRLLYVALTRARHALWLGVPMLQAARSKATTTINHKSATGYALAGPEERTPDDWRALLDAFSAGQDAVQWQAVQDAPARSLLQARAAPPQLLDAPPYAAQFDRRWGIGSFSSLVRALAAPTLPVSPVPLQQPADDELPMESDAPAPAQPAAPAQAAVWHRFMKGPVVGNWVHDELEWLAGEGFALEADGQGPLAQRLLQRSERAGRAAQGADLLAWLKAVVHHPLAPLGVPLSGLDQVLPEMEFWLPAARLPAPEIDRLCQQHLLAGQPRPALPARQLHGMLMGFADLVFEHEGRYWVLDYKTNFLGRDAAAYDERALREAMAAHRYDVQAALYLLALHRLLQSRLGAAYDPEQHLGGALYFFVRGIDGPALGMHVVPPSLALLDALGTLLDTPDLETQANLP